MFNAGSRDHIANRLKTLRGWKPTVFGKDGKPTVDADILATLKYPEAIQISDYLMLQKRIGQLAEGQKSCLKYVQPVQSLGGVPTTLPTSVRHHLLVLNSGQSLGRFTMHPQAGS